MHNIRKINKRQKCLTANIRLQHDKKIKSVIIIGIYLRTYNICRSHYLHDEEKYNENAFKLLQNPNYFIILKFLCISVTVTRK